MSKARGIIVGLGRMGTYHLRVLSTHPQAEVVAVVDPARDRRATAPEHIPAFASLGEALEFTQADFVCAATPASSLSATAHEAIAAGLAVMLEKPMAIDEASAQKVVEHAEEEELLLAVGLVERCNPAVAALRVFLEQQTAGRIHHLHARRLSPYPGRQSPVGVALDLATHDLDVIRFITGSEFDRVYAETATLGDEPGEDLISATLRMESGSTALIDVNWLTPTKVRQLSVTCEGGLFVVDYLTQDLTFFQHPQSDNEWDILRMMRGTGEGDMLRYGIARREPLLVQWDRFLTALSEGGSPAATGRDGIAALSTARAIQRSGARHEPVVPGYRHIPAR